MTATKSSAIVLFPPCAIATRVALTVLLCSGFEPDQQVEEFTFETNQVYAFDIVMSTGEGRAREEAARTTVYKRAIDRSYQLKLQASRALFSEIQKRFPVHPFSLRYRSP